MVIMQAAKMMRTADLMSFLALLSVCCCASAVSPHPFPGAAIHLGNAQLEDDCNSGSCYPGIEHCLGSQICLHLHTTAAGSNTTATCMV